MKDLLWFFAVATTAKLLLIPSYHSTDFEVHRHWLALTSSLPLAQWYTDTSSPWTLDYPPLFAFFQRLLAVAADAPTLDIAAPKEYASPASVLFLRLSVVVSDVTLLVAAHLLTRRCSGAGRPLVLALVLWSPALLIVDHVHFQYNGYLLGILMVSMAFLEERRDLAGGFVFAVLICSKHLFLVAAPLYFVYLLRHYCVGGFWRRAGRFVVMGAAVGAVFVVAFGPFLYYGQVCELNAFQL